MLPVVPFARGVSSFAYLQLMFIHRMHLYRHVRMRYGYVSLTLRSAVSCPTPHLGVLLSWFFVARLGASQTFPSRTLQSARDFCEELFPRE